MLRWLPQQMAEMYSMRGSFRSASRSSQSSSQLRPVGIPSYGTEVRSDMMKMALVAVPPSWARNMRPSPVPAPSRTISMKIPQKTPSAVMMLRLRLREIVCQISFQRSVSKNPVIVWFLFFLPGVPGSLLLFSFRSVVVSRLGRVFNSYPPLNPFIGRGLLSSFGLRGASLSVPRSLWDSLSRSYLLCRRASTVFSRAARREGM